MRQPHLHQQQMLILLLFIIWVKIIVVIVDIYATLKISLLTQFLYIMYGQRIKGTLTLTPIPTARNGDTILFSYGVDKKVSTLRGTCKTNNISKLIP